MAAAAKASLSTSSKMPLDLLGLSEDAMLCILKKLTLEDLLTVGCVCKSLYHLASSDYLWMNLCNHWHKHADLKKWRMNFNSAKSLFIQLNSFQKLIGVWKAKELYPRGGILYIKWGDLCLIASRVWAEPAGDVILRPVFEVIGLQDGLFKIKLLTGDVDFKYPAELVWSSKGEVEFEFQLCESSEASSSVNTGERECADESNSSISNGQTKLLQTRHLTSIVNSLGPDHSVLDAHDEILDALLNSTRALQQRFLRPANQQAGTQDQESTRYFDCAIQCLRSMYAFNNQTPGAGIVLSSKRINKSAYTKLKLDEPNPGQELAGLWSGIYGTHGLEIVNISYTNDEIIATKLLGDPNVPCNEVTFKVTLSSVNMDAQMDFQRILMGIGDHDAFHESRMYRGHGRIAGNRFRNPKWVPGRLLVQCNGNMAFLWEDDGFVINFHRLHLESLPVDME